MDVIEKKLRIDHIVQYGREIRENYDLSTFCEQQLKDRIDFEIIKIRFDLETDQDALESPFGVFYFEIPMTFEEIVGISDIK